jgi:probable phosphoglycerate mutase
MVQITEDIREWDYGDYEGITSAQIKEERKSAGLEPWDIWRDGCPGGEYALVYPHISDGEALRCR